MKAPQNKKDLLIEAFLARDLYPQTEMFVNDFSGGRRHAKSFAI
jgi:hypothetical protein